MNGFNLTGRTALVTGSSRGIGLAIAGALHAAGCKVILHGSKKTEALEAAAGAMEMPFVAAALGEEGAVAKLGKFCEANGLSPDILVLNASQQKYIRIEEFDMEEFKRESEINVGVNFELLRHFLPPMRSRGWGRVLAVGSVNAVKPSPRLSIYSTTKAALSNLMSTCAREYGEYGITANTILPGVICTDRNREVLSDDNFSENLRKQIPMKRFGMPEDCAYAALLLCSDAGGYITGAELPIAGGLDL